MPSRRARHLAGIAACLVTTSVLGLGAAPPVQAAGRQIVRPGESIQQAVDRARPGETILLLPGTYRGSVLVTVPDLTIRGAGSTTVITPAAPAVRTPGAAGAAAGSEPTGGSCAAPGHGICVLGTAGHRVAGVRIESLTVSGFAKNGVSGSETDRMTVRDVLVENNGEQGISQEKSIRGRLVGNHARHNGQAGIFLANDAYAEGGALDTEGAVIKGNDLTGNRIGTVLRRARNLTVELNSITGNCAGVFVIGDEGRPRGGALTVRGNRVNENNTYCPPNARLPYLQGIGIVLTGVEDTLVTRNQVNGNVGASPMSGGVVLFHSFVGGPDINNTIRGNEAVGNGPADLADRDRGAGNTFSGNTCRISEPAGRHC
ncbi:right-handed parallel beta-helix repeat-containing protein [Streptomyces sp. H10-C2]|uniref:right-handed parallel beta-helix repeat-containing protein n=1 Tax=unclassified Streptomyces TaxID=2593676 RepID=UPI0024BB33EC|nr:MULTISPECIES: right-handed parallel beta-helix repeat-containing protein [unclassified Streptomyces]MDJ0345178.1 right-handed parallel beta-helix repeat-containing protein [Streptomyces sp. PH10-H1]MDJ0374146.1 right-handed parallel beta-helix repeat-containing protein [Streptomyces sp. H10-C2]